MENVYFYPVLERVFKSCLLNNATLFNKCLYASLGLMGGVIKVIIFHIHWNGHLYNFLMSTSCDRIMLLLWSIWIFLIGFVSVMAFLSMWTDLLHALRLKVTKIVLQKFAAFVQIWNYRVFQTHCTYSCPCRLICLPILICYDSRTFCTIFGSRTCCILVLMLMRGNYSLKYTYSISKCPIYSTLVNFYLKNAFPCIRKHIFFSIRLFLFISCSKSCQ